MESDLPQPQEQSVSSFPLPEGFLNWKLPLLLSAYQFGWSLVPDVTTQARSLQEDLLKTLLAHKHFT